MHGYACRYVCMFKSMCKYVWAPHSMQTKTSARQIYQCEQRALGQCSTVPCHTLNTQIIQEVLVAHILHQAVPVRRHPIHKASAWVQTKTGEPQLMYLWVRRGQGWHSTVRCCRLWVWLSPLDSSIRWGRGRHWSSGSQDTRSPTGVCMYRWSTGPWKQADWCVRQVFFILD